MYRVSDAPAVSRPFIGPIVAGVVIAAAVVGGAILYKSTGAMRALTVAERTSSLPAKARWIPLEGVPEWLRPVAETLNYFSWIALALLFGILIGAVVRAALPARWTTRALAGRGPVGVMVGAAIGAPLMLCACCVAPVFDGTYARTRRLGPALALMLAAPGLNPADLAVTFLVFPRGIALARLALSLLLVFGVGISSGLFREKVPAEVCAIDEPAPSWSAWQKSFVRTLAETAWRTLPAMLLGALLSAIVIQLDSFSSPLLTEHTVLAVLLAAGVATLIALPTFGEIPLGLALLAAGAPTGAVVAVLVAGPIINIPSLLVLRRATSWRLATGLAALVMVVAFGGGLAAGFLIGT